MPEEFGAIPNTWQIIGGLATGVAVAIAWLFGRRFSSSMNEADWVISPGEMARIRVDVEHILTASRDALFVRLEQSERNLREELREIEVRLRRIEETSAVIKDRVNRLDKGLS